jgi:hypothetical protein
VIFVLVLGGVGAALLPLNVGDGEKVNDER